MQYLCNVVIDHVTIDHMSESNILGEYQATMFQFFCFNMQNWSAPKINAMGTHEESLKLRARLIIYT